MSHTTICNGDCFNCIHPDCIRDDIRAEDYQFARDAEKEYLISPEQKKLAAKKRAYREAHLDEIKAKKQAYYEANRDEIAVKRRAYYEAHRDEFKAKQRAYYEANRDEIAAKRKAKRKAPESIMTQ